MTGLLVTLGDQKAVVFYLGFLPAFIELGTLSHPDIGAVLASAVLAVGGVKLGYAYAAPFRARAAYRYTVEDSVYVAPDALGQGVGRAVLSKVLEACKAMGLRQVIAVIGDSANAASIGLHHALGFEPGGVGRSVGFKHGRWVDVVWMQKALGGGDSAAPSSSGLTLSGH